LNEYRISRVTVADVHQMLRSPEPPVIVDLRHPLDFLHEPRVLPGALRITAEEVAADAHKLPKDRDLILYCT
jgi:rhodanese-related sulfurtransferase